MICRRPPSAAPVFRGLAGVPLLLLVGCSHAPGQPPRPDAPAQESRPAATVPAAAPAATQPARRTLLAWVETFNEPRRLNDVVDGAAAWRGVADGVIVSVGPDEVGLFRGLQDRMPGVRLIPGIKTSPILRRTGLDNPAGWARLADAMRAACAITGSRVILLENESAIKDYIDGRETVDFERLRAGLRQLPTDVELIWYPSVSGTEGTLERATRLCREVQAVCRNVRFVDHGTLFSERSRFDGGVPRLQAALKSAATAPPIQLIYCGERYWRLERVPEAIRLATSDTVILYPGADRWKEASRILAATLAADRQQRPPP